MDFIREVQWRDTSYTIFNIEVDWKRDGKEAARRHY